MSAKILAFRRVPASQAELRRRIGQGLALDFELGDEQGVLSLRQAGHDAIEGGVTLTSGAGPLHLNRASALLGLFSNCPALLPDGAADGEPDDHDWYWSLYNQCLAPQLRTLFGHLGWSGQTPVDGLPCELQVRLGEHLVRSEALLPVATLEQLLARPGWQALGTPPPLDWRISSAVVLGYGSLSMRQLKSLRRGDVVLPDRPLFRPDGSGCLFLGSQCLRVRLEVSPIAHFVITSLEETAMNAYASDFTADPILSVDTDEPLVADERLEEASFDDLPLALTLNCGRLTLTLGELKSLGAGSVLSLGKGTPGFATLCHDDRPLAHGELVDVDGHIGLQITRLEIGR